MPSLFKAPRIRAKDPLANKDGTPTNAFVRFWDTFCKVLEQQERSQGEVLEMLAEQLALILAAQATADEALIKANDKSGSFVAEIASLPGGVASKSLTNVPARTYLDLSANISGGSLDADAPFYGTATFAESDGATTNALATVPVTVNSSGLVVPGPAWAADASSPIEFAGFGALSGNVTYTLSISHDSGSSYVAGGAISGLIKVTPSAT